MKLNASLDSFFNRASVAINNALAIPKIQAYLKEYGYPPEKIQQGKTLYETALESQQQQRKKYGEQISATQAFNELWTTAKESYMRYLKIARIAFKNETGIITELALNGIRKQTFSGWLSQANQFFENALNNPQVLVELKEYGITKAKLKAAQADTKAVEAASLLQEKKKGNAQNATQIRDQAIEELNDWLKDFMAIARIALEPEPQLLESLGIRVNS
jgi:hypothetical protein